MGIKGLFPVIQPILVKTHISEFANQRVAIDAYAWLHRAVFSCAADICRNIPTTSHFEYVIYRINLLLNFNITPILIFDGGSLPLKSDTHKERRQKREEAKQKADQFYANGNMKQANEWYQRACGITNEMVRQLITTIEHRYTQSKVQCVVAPYEADAQLTWMIRENRCDFIITEDSDLLVYGATKILYKLQKDGSGDLYTSENLKNLKNDISLLSFTNDMFMYMCVCSGCDFFKGINGLGIKKAYPIIKKYKGNIHRIFLDFQLNKRLKVHLNFKQLKIDFIRACLVFRHQTIYDFNRKQMAPLNPLSDFDIQNLASDHIILKRQDPDNPDTDQWDLDFLGKLLPDEMASKVVHAKSHPNTLQPYPADLFQIIKPSNLNRSRRRRASLPTNSKTTPNTFINTAAPNPTATPPIPLPTPTRTTTSKNVSGFVVQPARLSQQIRINSLSTAPALATTDTSNYNHSRQKPTSVGLQGSVAFNPRREARRFSDTFIPTESNANVSSRQNIATSAVWSKFRCSTRNTQGLNLTSNTQNINNSSKHLDSDSHTQTEQKRGESKTQNERGEQPVESSLRLENTVEFEIPDIPDVPEVEEDNCENANETVNGIEHVSRNEDEDEQSNGGEMSNTQDPNNHIAMAIKRVTESETQIEKKCRREEEANNYLHLNVEEEIEKEPNPISTQKTDGLSRVMRRFAAKPVEKRLKFVDVKQSRPPDDYHDTENDAQVPPSPDYDSYRLFDEIDQLSRERSDQAVNSRTNNMVVAGNSSSLLGHRRENKNTLPKQRTGMSTPKIERKKLTPKRLTPTSATNKDGKGKVQVRVSRFFTSTAACSSRDNMMNNSQTQIQSQSQSTPESSTPRLGLVTSKIDQKGSPSARVTAAMKLKGFERKRVTKRKIDDLAHEIKGKKIRASS